MTDRAGRWDRRTLLASGLGAAAVTAVGGELALPAAARAAGPQATAAQAAAPQAAGAQGIGSGATPTSVLDFIVTCDSWAARPPSSTLVMNTGTTQKIVVHHTAYPNSTDYSVNQAIWLARDIQRLHMDVNGWADTGQHFTVSRGGFILEGRHRSLEGLRSGAQQVVAAHSPGENGRGIGIENEGTYVTDTPPRPLLDSLRTLCVAICAQYGLGAHAIFGHWDFRVTECPGITFYRLFPELRRGVAGALGTRLSEIPERTWPNIISSSTGPVVSVLQYLLKTRGYPVTPTGTFDAGTVAAVQDFQVQHGMPPAGLGEMTGPTWDSLVPALDSRSTGDAVAAVQSILIPKGYQVTLTGIFDAATSNAVREMQRLHGLAGTGRVDVATWCAIVGGVVRAEFRSVLKR